MAKKMVWHIFEFFERYEYTHDAYKKRPLNFIKSFVGSGTDDISAGYFKQIQDLWLYDDYHLLKSVFADIRDISANAGVIHRGWLLDGSHRPATNSLIGSWVKLDAKQAGSVLKKLAKVGLIERVPLPDFETMEDPAPPPKTPEPPEKPKTKTQIAAEKRKVKQVADAVKKAADNAANAEKRKLGKKREKTGKKGRPLKNGKTANGKNGKDKNLTASGRTAKGKSKQKTALTGQGENEHQEPQGPMPDHHPAADAAKGKGRTLRARTGAKGAQGSDKRPLPLKPTEADGPHSRAHEDADGSSTSTEADGGVVSSRRANAPDGRPPQHYDKPTFEQKYDQGCRDFAVMIYQTIRTMYPIDSPEAYRELAVFAQQWSYAQRSGIGDERIGILWGKGIEQARLLGNKRRMGKGARKPEAVWVTIFKKRLAAAVAEAGDNSVQESKQG